MINYLNQVDEDTHFGSCNEFTMGINNDVKKNTEQQQQENNKQQ
jgi:hypothetical protein